MSTALLEIQKTLAAKADKNNMAFFEKMVPGQQKIYGVKTPELNLLAQRFKSGSFILAKELWQSGALEERIIAIKIIEKTGKSDPAEVMKLFKSFSREIDNWAVCDGLGMQFLRGIVKTHAEDIFSLAEKFSGSEDPWQRRLSLVMVEWYTRMKEYHPGIKKLVKKLENDEEYYVKKAVAWINRNLKKDK
jgi:3-methyladenine DNA glycosylase AlkD